MSSVKPMRAMAAILFSMGSILLVVELAVRLMIEKDDLTGGWEFLSESSIFGILGIAGWLAGFGVLVHLKLSRPTIKDSGNNVFLAGKKNFKCRTCKRVLDASRVGYHQRIRCRCGTLHDVFQEMEWERD